MRVRVADAVAVGGGVALQARLKLGGALEAELLDNLGDAVVDALDHAVGLRVAGW